MKLVDNVEVLPMVTRLDLQCERVLNAAIEAKLTRVVVIGMEADGSFYFASTTADGGTVLWDIEVAKKRLLDAGGA